MYLLVRFFRWNNNRRRKINLAARMKDRILKYNTLLDNTISDFEHVVASARESLKLERDLKAINDLQRQGEKCFTEEGRKITGYIDLINSDVDEAVEVIDEPHLQLINSIELKIANMIRDYTEAVANAPVKVKTADLSVENARLRLQKLVDKGYKINISDVLESATELSEKASSNLQTDSYDPVMAIGNAAKAVAKAAEVVAAHDDMVKGQSTTDSLIMSLRRELLRLNDYRKTSVPKYLAELQSYPDSVRKPLMDELEPELKEDRIENLTQALDDAEDQNSMLVQHFSNAATIVDVVSQQVSNAKQILESVKLLKAKLTDAYRQSIAFIPELARDLESVRRTVNHSDVQRRTKTLLDEAEAQFESVKKFSTKDQYQDWISILETLEQIGASCDKAVSLAREDKRKAESDRDDARRAAERKRSEERSRSSYSGYSGSSSSSSSGSSSNDSFGGFGGGGFDGGGAGGGY